MIHIKIISGRFVTCFAMPPIQPGEEWPQHLHSPRLLLQPGFDFGDNIAAYKLDHAD